MSTIKLISNQSNTATAVSNLFIDFYMPYANGEYVKVYIYLLRLISSGTHTINISSIADRLSNTETDVIRAFHYWEKCNLLSIEKSASGEIISINLENVKSKKEPVITPVSISNSEAAATTEFKQNRNIERPSYTEAQINQLTNTDEMKWLLNIIELYLERLLTPTDIQLILFLYENLGFSTDLIMHLYDYCVSKNKKSPSYIEAVALAWAEEGIDTIEKADVSISNYNNNYNAVGKTFGLNRQPGTVEKKFIDTWISKFGFSIDIIIEACNRTLLRTGKPDFIYTNKIIENWYTNNVKTKADISVLDAKHNNKITASQKTSTASKPKTNNQFNAFPQRNYSKEDFSSLEQHLLNKQ